MIHKKSEENIEPPVPVTTLIGLCMTFFWIIISVKLILNHRQSISSLNEWGDFLAGMVGPLALLWLVLGYFQQQKELRQNTEAINLQRLELERTANEQERLAINSTSQFELMVSPFVAVRMGEISNRNGVFYREAWAQNIGAHAAYFGHTLKHINILDNQLDTGFWCAGDEHYIELTEMERNIGQLAIQLYNRNGDLVLNVIQFEKGEKGVPKSGRLVANQVLVGSTSVSKGRLDIGSIEPNN